MIMETVSKKPGKWAKNLSLLGLCLCALCCALPVIGILGGTSLLAVIALYAEKVALVFFIVSAGLFAFWLFRKKQAPPSCAVDCSCKTENHESKSVSV